MPTPKGGAAARSMAGPKGGMGAASTTGRNAISSASTPAAAAHAPVGAPAAARAPAAAHAPAAAPAAAAPAAPAKHASISGTAVPHDREAQAAKTIQKLQRGHSGRNLLATSKHAATVIEKVERGKLARDHLEPELRTKLAGAGRAAMVAASLGGSSKGESQKSSKKSLKVGGELPADAGQESRWTAPKWLGSLGLHTVVAEALKLPENSEEHLDYVTSLTSEGIAELLTEAQLEGLVSFVISGLERLCGQSAKSGAELNDKFASSAKFQVSPCARACG